MNSLLRSWLIRKSRFFSTVGTYLYIILLCPFLSRTKRKSEASARLKIRLLGNGPSLQFDLPKVMEKRDEWLVASVNFFALHDNFNSIKPDFYILIDPHFFPSNADGRSNRQVDALMAKLLAVSWKIVIYVPSINQLDVARRLQSNLNITVRPISAPYSPVRSEILYRLGLRSGKFQPARVNVLVSALWIFLDEGSEMIEIFGADSDGFKKIEVDQNGRSVRTNVEYFSDLVSSDLTSKVSKPVSRRLYQHYLTFLSHDEIKNLSNYYNTTIINRSKHSLLDMYPKG